MSYLPKRRPTYSFDGMRYTRTEPNQPSPFANSRRLAKARRKARKREAKLLLQNATESGESKKACKHWCPSVESLIHECSIERIYPNTARRKLLFEDLQRNLSSHYSRSNEIIEKIIDSLKRNDNLKSSLPSNALKANLKTVEFPSYSESYTWKNDVINPAVYAKDQSIIQMVDSALFDPARYKNELNEVLGDLNEAVNFEGFINTWNWLDSYLYGVVTRDSEMKLHFECAPIEKNCGFIKEPEDIFEEVLKSLKACKLKFDNVEDASNALFPSIKADSKSIGKTLLITFSSDFNSCEMNVAKSLLMKLYVDMSPNLKYLFVFVKIIFRNYGCRTDIQKSEYAMFWLVVFFMQQKKLLPAVIDVRKAAKMKHYVGGWDCSLPENYSYPTEPVSLYGLLLEFLEFYERFDFIYYVICPYLGRVFRISDFEQFKIPMEDFSLYVKQLNNPRQCTFIRNIANLQDPTDLCHNVALYLSPRNISNVFKFMCHRLSQLLANSVTKMETMGCFCKVLVREEILYTPVLCNLTQYTILIFKTEELFNFSSNLAKRLNQTYILEATRTIMELIFEFEKKSIVICQNITQRTVNETRNIIGLPVVKRTFPVIYLEYCSSENTWNNDFIEEIIFRNEDEKNMIKIYITCEVCLEFEEPFVKFFVQGCFEFVRFLHEHFLRLFMITLNELIAPNVVN